MDQRRQEKLPMPALFGGLGGVVVGETRSSVSVRQTTTMVVRGLGRAFLCLSLSLSVALDDRRAIMRKTHGRFRSNSPGCRTTDLLREAPLLYNQWSGRPVGSLV